MAITKRLVKGSALTHTELDGNFTDYETFKALYNTVDYSVANDGKVLYWDNSANTVRVKTLSASDISNFSSQFDTLLAGKTTANLTEDPSNLYFTNARADARVDGVARITVPSYTTTARDALSSVANGEIIYNTTDNKLQAYENSAWVNLV
ncbi:hypothetical protein CMK13_00175 [Candidatus Poribacteria bacterium]|nr:hypothetical protein [Candidatus Poribacteria bacterium]OUW02002.1 MAG: hypothetical protein CBD16_04685 [Betaproteobacteria bacterium TMED156]OUW02996.1 MAG: hypothetical protein CBD16_03660 [Betaproteobacteria bacterium TMED156]|tara:strand:+ start:576 stop:1028 length:453 start_codon:yes stop_codon:yes gene_type:complete